MTANHDHTAGRTELEAGDIIYDGASGESLAVIVDVDDAGVTVRQGDVESFIPHALFAPWNGDELLVSHADTERSDGGWSEADTHEQPC